MARVTIEDCLDKVESRFALVHLAVRRVLQHRRGVMPLVEAPKNKEVVLALREIAATKITRDNIEYYEEAAVAAVPKAGGAAPQAGRLEEIREIVDEATLLSGAPGLEEEPSGEEEDLAGDGEDTEE